MKRSLLLLLLISGTLLSGAEKVDPALLFKVTFDGYSTDADFAKGKKQAQNGNQFELNLRMFQGVNGKGNALAMDKSEQLQWNAVKNVDPRQGTVSLWLSPVNWQVAAKSEHRFLQIFTNDFHLQLRRDKNSDERIVLYIHSPKISGSKKAYYATAHIDPAKWSKNSWHKVDITWDARGMKLYIDGILQQARRNMITKVDSGTRIGPVYPETAFPPETFFPDQVKYGIIRLGQVMKIAAQCPDAELAALVVQTISEIAPEIVADAVEAGSCKVVSDVYSSAKPVYPDIPRNSFMLAALALLAVCGFVVLRELFNDYIVDDNDLERKLGITVIGVIPDVEG